MSYLSKKYYNGDGSTQTFSLPSYLTYILQTHIHVYIDDGEGFEEDTTYTWDNPTTVRTTAVPPSGTDNVLIKRITPNDARLVDFQDAAICTEADLDKSARQNFFILQERYDSEEDYIAIAEDGMYDALDKRLKNIGTPTGDDDATPKCYVDDKYDLVKDWATKTDAPVETDPDEYSAKEHAIGTQTRGESGGGSSKDWASLTSGTVDDTNYSAKEHAIGTQTRGQSGGGSAKDWASYTGGTVDDDKFSANYYAQQAETAKTAAQAAQTGAETAETNAETAETGAETAQTAAETAETNAEAAEAKAEDWADEDEDVEVETGKYSAKHWAAKAQAAMTVPGEVHRAHFVYAMRMAFTSGGTYEVTEGDTVEGHTSGASAIVQNVVVTSGSWSGGDAAGNLYVNMQFGTFGSETLDVGANIDVATITGDTQAYSFVMFPGTYHHDGTSEQTVYWDEKLAIDKTGQMTTEDWNYLYIDDSAVVSLGSPELTADEFCLSNTEPVWSDSKRGWYNGLDRCIFGFYVDEYYEIQEFFHNEDIVLYGDAVQEINNVDIDDTWTSVTLTAPSFATEIEIAGWSKYVDGTTNLMVRPKYAQATDGHIIARSEVGITFSPYQSKVITNPSQKMEVKHEAANGNTVYVRTDGWYFPTGM